MSKFKEQVVKLVSRVPYGKVVSYGQVAAALGSPRAARQVGWTLRSLDGDDKVPWWRVVNNEGRISIKGNMYSTPERQKQLLEAEGIVIDKNFSFDIEKYRFEFKSNK
jgi:methylated-DNA-protein-cysteine methyltransferase related protein